MQAEAVRAQDRKPTEHVEFSDANDTARTRAASLLAVTLELPFVDPPNSLNIMRRTKRYLEDALKDIQAGARLLSAQYKEGDASGSTYAVLSGDSVTFFEETHGKLTGIHVLNLEREGFPSQAWTLTMPEFANQGRNVDRTQRAEMLGRGQGWGPLHSGTTFMDKHAEQTWKRLCDMGLANKIIDGGRTRYAFKRESL